MNFSTTDSFVTATMSALCGRLDVILNAIDDQAGEAHQVWKVETEELLTEMALYGLFTPLTVLITRKQINGGEPSMLFHTKDKSYQGEFVMTETEIVAVFGTKKQFYVNARLWPGHQLQIVRKLGDQKW